MSIRKTFNLSETLAGTLGALCDRYNLDCSWLAWQYEKHVLLGGASPFRITTNDYARYSKKQGVDTVKFDIVFDPDNPNLIKFIRFEELPSQKQFIVTETSMKHISEGATCPVFIELPHGYGACDTEMTIDVAQHLESMDLCCLEWHNCLPANPVTALERAKFHAAQSDAGWLRIHLDLKERELSRMAGQLACKNIQATGLDTALRIETEKVAAQVIKCTHLDEKIAELKGDAMVASKVHDKIVRELEDRLKELEKEIKSEKNTAEKLRSQLSKVEAEMLEQQSSSAKGPPTKKRKVQPRTPMKKVAHNPPKTVPVPQKAPPFNFDPQSPTSRTRRSGRLNQTPSESRTPTHAPNTRSRRLNARIDNLSGSGHEDGGDVF